MAFQPAPRRLGQPARALGALLATLLCHVGTARAEEPIAVVSSVSVKQSDTGITVRVDLSNARDVKRNVLTDPYKVYFDFANTRLRSDQTQTFPLHHPLLYSVRVGQFSDNPATARVVFDLTAEREVKLARDNDGRTLLFTVNGGAGTPPPVAAKSGGANLTRTSLEESTPATATLLLGVSPQVGYRAFYLSGPDRVVLDLDGTNLKAEAPPAKDDGLVSAVRVSQFADDIVRIVLDVRHPCAYQVVKRPGEGLALRLFSGDAKGRLIVIDPGHGGKDNGCEGYREGLWEKDVVLDIGQRVRQLLEAKGIRAEMTRDDDTFIPLDDRPALANRIGADAFVSIHCNAMPDSMKGQRSGTELYWFNDVSPQFAQIMLQEVSRSVGLEARGTDQRRFVVVKGCSMPSVLVETGYLDSSHDGALLGSADGRQTFAQGIVNGVVRFLKTKPPVVASQPAKTAEPKG